MASSDLKVLGGRGGRYSQNGVGGRGASKLISENKKGLMIFE